MTGAATQDMRLDELFAGTGADAPSITVSDISTRAQKVQRGGLFVAMRGEHSHGLEYVDSALAAGAVAVAWDPADAPAEPGLPAGVTGIRVRGLPEALPSIANRFFRCPSAEVEVTGVTGTNGKTTTAWLVAHALNAMKIRTGYMGTLGYGIGELRSSLMTTPGCVTVHRRLRELADRGARHVIAEVSSHGLAQNRVGGVRFRVAALTNLSRDHLDYHGSMEQYAAAKAKLFTGDGLCTAVINTGDTFGRQLARRLEPRTRIVSVALMDTGPSRPRASLLGTLCGSSRDGIGVELSGDFGDANIDSPLWGRFNAENLTVAAGILVALGCGLGPAAAALECCGPPPGRMEPLGSPAGRPAVVVDFAHTPAALAAALEAARDHCDGDLWCVFGCGGGRDRGKRALMGTAAARLADRCVLTDDNPRHEDPAAIVRDILAGAGDARRVDVIHDRAAAIAYAIDTAGPGDVVLIAGRGNEIFQKIDNDSVRFEDAVVARTALGLAT